MKTPHAIDVYVGQRIRSGRMLRDLSQEKLADALNLTFQQVQKYEKGANRVSCSRLVEIARAMSLPVSYFFEGVANDAAAPTTEGQDITRLMGTRLGAEIVKVWPNVEAKGLGPLVLNVAQLAAHGPEAKLT